MKILFTLIILSLSACVSQKDQLIRAIKKEDKKIDHLQSVAIQHLSEAQKLLNIEEWNLKEQRAFHDHIKMGRRFNEKADEHIKVQKELIKKLITPPITVPVDNHQFGGSADPLWKDTSHIKWFQPEKLHIRDDGPVYYDFGKDTAETILNGIPGEGTWKPDFFINKRGAFMGDSGYHKEANDTIYYQVQPDTIKVRLAYFDNGGILKQRNAWHVYEGDTWSKLKDVFLEENKQRRIPFSDGSGKYIFKPYEWGKNKN